MSSNTHYGRYPFNPKSYDETLATIAVAMQRAVFQAALNKQTPAWETLNIEIERERIDNTRQDGIADSYEISTVLVSVLGID